MYLVLDGAVLLVMLIFIGIGIHRGAVRTIVEFVGFFAALAAAAIVSNAVTVPLYETWVSPVVLETMTNALSDIAAGSADPLAALTEKMPEFVVRYFESSHLQQNLSQALTLGAAEGAQMLADSVVAPVVQLLIRVLVAVVTFIVATWLIRLIAGAADLVAKLPVLHQLNQGLGAVCGAAKGLIIVFVAAALLKALLPFLPENEFLTAGHIEESMIFQKVCEINPLKNWIKGI